MARFGERRSQAASEVREAPAAVIVPDDPAARVAAAQAALHTAQAEAAEIEAMLAAHRQQRESWLIGGGQLDHVVELGAEDERLRRRRDAIEAELPPLRHALGQAQVALRAAGWTDLGVAEAESGLRHAVLAMFTAYDHFVAVCREATRRGFATELQDVARAPDPIQTRTYALNLFLQQIEHREALQGGSYQAPPSIIPDAWAHVESPKPPRWLPTKVNPHEVERQSALSYRWVKVLHSVKTPGLGAHPRVVEGEVMQLNSREANYLIQSGAAAYCDAPETAGAPTAAA